MAQGAQAVSSSPKPWYKKWWGIILLILFWPISVSAFLINYIWKKTKWSQGAKIGATIAVVVIVGCILLSFGGSGTPSDSSAPSEASSDTASAEAQKPEVKQVFDIPSLVGKNLNEVKVVLGPIEHDTEPTKAQIDIGITEWEKSWEREGADLLVTYDVKTKKVVDFFVSGVDPSGSTKDKQLLLTVGGIKEGQPEYDVEFVQVINKPGQYTGVKVIPVDQKARAALIEKRANFDTKRGTDAFAAERALSLIKIAQDLGLEMDIYIKADVPADVLDGYLKGGSETDLRTKTKSALLSAVVSNTTWALIPDSTKKDFVISLLTRIKEAYPNAVPRVIVSNGIRNVAEGSFSVWSGDKVELK